MQPLATQPLATQPFILPPPPSTQFPVPTTFGGGSPASVRHTVQPLNSTNQLPMSNATPTTNAMSDLLGDLSLNFNPSLMMQQPKPAGVLGQISVPPTAEQPKPIGVPGQIPVPAATAAPQIWGAFHSDPLAVLDNLYVPKENIQPGLQLVM